jgi:hypothetical protein
VKCAVEIAGDAQADRQNIKVVPASGNTKNRESDASSVIPAQAGIQNSAPVCERFYGCLPSRA